MFVHYLNLVVIDEIDSIPNFANTIHFIPTTPLFESIVAFKDLLICILAYKKVLTIAVTRTNRYGAVVFINLFLAYMRENGVPTTEKVLNWSFLIFLLYDNVCCQAGKDGLQNLREMNL